MAWVMSSAEGDQGEDATRLAALYDAYAADAYQLAYLLTGDRDLADDLAQEAFVRIVARFGHLRKRDRFEYYLRRTVVNLARSHFRRRSAEARYLAKQPGRSSAQEIPDIEIRNSLWQLLQQLPIRQRTALVLRFYEDLSEHQTADVMGVSLRAVNSLVSRGLGTLRRIEGGEEE